MPFFRCLCRRGRCHSSAATDAVVAVTASAAAAASGPVALAVVVAVAADDDGDGGGGGDGVSVVVVASQCESLGLGVYRCATLTHCRTSKGQTSLEKTTILWQITQKLEPEVLTPNE